MPGMNRWPSHFSSSSPTAWEASGSEDAASSSAADYATVSAGRAGPPMGLPRDEAPSNWINCSHCWHYFPPDERPGSEYSRHMEHVHGLRRRDRPH